MYSLRDVTSRPLIVMLGIKFLSFFLDKVMGSRLYMYTVAKMLVIVLCSLGGDH